MCGCVRGSEVVQSVMLRFPNFVCKAVHRVAFTKNPQLSQNQEKERERERKRKREIKGKIGRDRER